MNSLIRIRGKVIEVKPAKTGYYVAIQEQETSKKWRAFSQWEVKEGAYELTLRQDKEYFFIAGYQVLEVKVDKAFDTEPAKKTIYQPYEKEDNQAQRQLIQEYRAKINQLQTEVQQWKNAYYNQKWMLKKAQQDAHKRLVEAKIKAIENKPGRKSKQDLDYLKLLAQLSQEYKESLTWLMTN